MNEIIYEKCYAKINLILNVLNKKPNGFHEVDFIMSCLNIYDELSVEKSETFEIECEQLDIPVEDNLMYKAFMLLKKKYNLEDNVKLILNKKIPVAAGMAGGSSNAAGVLRACNILFGLRLTIEQLMQLGSEIGSDVPFCVLQENARATNQGEIIEPVNLKYNKFFVAAINPNIELSTKRVYESHVITNNHGDIDGFLNMQTFEKFKYYIHNDLQATTLKLLPFLKTEIDYIINEFKCPCIVSGSGPTLVIFSEDEDKISKIVDYYKQKKYKCYKTQMR